MKRALRSSFFIAHRIAKKMKTCSDDDFVKECLIDVAQEIFKNGVGNPENRSVAMDSGKAY